jgi:hypothetical protein
VFVYLYYFFSQSQLKYSFVDKTKNNMSIDVMIRHSKDEVLATLFESKDHIITHDIVEAMTVLRSENLSRVLGFDRIIFGE